MKQKNLIRCLSLFMATILLCLSFPVVAIAQDDTSIVQENTDMATETVANNTDIYIIQEDTSKRSEFEKHYFCSDGTFVVATYAEAVHYQDEDGVWQDIDMSFDAVTNATDTAYTAQSQNFALSVPTSAADGHLMQMENNGISFAWTLTAQTGNTLSSNAEASLVTQPSTSLQASSQVVPQVTSQNTTTTTQEQPLRRVDDEDAFALPNISNKVTYSDLFGEDAGISVVYTTYKNKVEEDIYIEKPTDMTSFSMVVDAPLLLPRVNSDNSVDFLDRQGEMQYHVGIPYMVDANHAVTHDIETSVALADGQWVVTYTPNAEWFTSSERAYPILLDPSITTNEYISNIQDTYVESSNTNHTRDQILYLLNSGDKAIFRVVNMPVIDASLPILDATFSCYATNTPMGNMVAYLQLDYTETNTGIALNNYTYANATTALAASEYAANTYLSYGLYWARFNLKPYIYQILEGGGDFIVGYTPNTDHVFIGGFTSSEHTSVDYHPVMTVTYGYAVPKDITTGNSYTFHNLGSWSFMSVPIINAPVNSNVYQIYRPNDIPTSYDHFKLTGSATAGYKLHHDYAYLDTSKVIEAAAPTSTQNINSARNVYIGNSTTSGDQQWLFIPASNQTYYIVLKSNMNMCLTAYGDADGTGGGTSVTSPGNIFVQPISENNPYQKWMICNTNGTEIPPDASSNGDNGEYHLINQQSGRYLYRYNGTTLSSRGVLTETKSQDTVKVSNIGENDETYTIYKSFVSWRLTNLQNGYCTIQIMDDTGIYHLYADTATNTAKIGNMSADIPDKYQWYVSIASGGMRIQSKLGIGNGTGYLTDTGNITLDQSTIALEAYDVSDGGQVWRLQGIENYKDATKTMSFQTLTMDIGDVKAPTISNPDGCTLSDASDFYYLFVTGAGCATVNQNTGKFTGITSGTAMIQATHKTTGQVFPLSINVNPLLIYHTMEQKDLGYVISEIDNSVIPITPEDLCYDDLSTATITSNGSLVSMNDLFNANGPISLSDRVNIIESFFQTQLYDEPTFETILCDMMGLFVEGQGQDYSNSILTAAVEEHPRTQSYVDEVINIVKEQIGQFDGSVSNLYYDEQLWLQPAQRDNQVIVAAMHEKIAADEAANGKGNSNLFLPSYGLNNGVKGLTLAIDGWHANKIELESFQTNGNSYSGTLTFTFYDHFGLDTPDLSEEKLFNIQAGILAGFRQWYILQHWRDLGYDVQPKPFVTVVSFSVPFSGTYGG